MKKKLYKHFNVYGITENDNPVIGGIFYLFQTRGIPPEITINELVKRGFVPAWDDFIKDALNHGMDIDYIKTWISNIVADVYGLQYLKEFKLILERYIDKNHR